MKFLFILSGLLFFVGCENFEYYQPLNTKAPRQDKRDQKSDTNTNTNTNSDVPTLTLQDVRELDLDEITEKANKALNSKNCTKHNSGVQLSIIGAITSGFGVTNPLQSIKNCVAYSIDVGLKPLCDYERALEDLKKQYRNDDVALDEIDETLDILETSKHEFTDQLYRISDDLGIDRDRSLDRIEDKNSGIGEDLFRLAVDTEYSNFINFFERRANNVCPNFRRPRN